MRVLEGEREERRELEGEREEREKKGVKKGEKI